MPTVKAQASSAMGRFPGKLMDALIRRPPRDEAATAEQREKVQQALEAFLRAFTAAKAGAAAAQLEQARIELLRALGESLAIATAVPLLQAFLRGAAVELVAALTAAAADSALFARHARAGGGGGGAYDVVVDLETQTVVDDAGFRAAFSIAPYHREMLLSGLDEIGRTLREEDRIGAYERDRETGKGKGETW